MNPEDQRQLERHLGRLFSESLNVSQPVAMLYIIKEKLADGGYDTYYKAELLDSSYRFGADGMNAISIPSNQLHRLRATPLNYNPL